MTDDLRTRAVRILGGTRGRPRWPYGLEDLTLRDRPDMTAAEFQQNRETNTAKQRTLVDWAERHRLRRSTSGCCPKWLQRQRSVRCRPSWPGGPCPHYDPPAETNDRAWMDHRMFWLRAGSPAVITSAPYGLSPESEARLSCWTADDPRLKWARGTGWYGYTTTQVVLWRQDLAPDIEPA